MKTYTVPPEDDDRRLVREIICPLFDRRLRISQNEQHLLQQLSDLLSETKIKTPISDPYDYCPLGI
jgi:hypothetical protein